MRMITVLVGVFCTAAPVFAQSRLYTNADLTSQPVTWTRTVTSEEWQGIAAREFRPLPYPQQATVYVIPSSPANDILPAPFPYRVSSSADRWWTDPILAYQLQHPIEAAFCGWGGHSFSRRRIEAPVRSSGPMITPQAPPSIVMSAAGSGKPATRR